VKKSSSEVPLDCRNLIDKLKVCSREEFLTELKTIETWTYGKCELYHWIDILDLCDDILEDATRREPSSWVLGCDQPGEEAAKLKELVLWTLHFTTLLIEHSFSRHLYSSMEHLSLLLSSFDLDVVLAVLNLLYMFSKRSNFISRLAPDKRQVLLNRLSHLAASWGGKDNGFGLSKCCSDDPISSFPPSATTLHFEFYAEVPGEQGSKSSQSSAVTVIHVDGLDKMNKTPASIMEDMLRQYRVPEEKQMLLFTYVRLAHGFSCYTTRLKSVQARLQALSVLIYSNQLTDSIQGLLYSGLLEELVDVLEMKGDHLMEIKAAALKALTSIIHLDRNPNFPKLNTIIDVTGAANFHGFLPVMVRNCIISLTSPTAANANSFPQPLATALFSFLYHLASYEAGGEALVCCGMMESLLKVIQWPSSELEHITFVTRAVRVIDLITNLDMASFQTHAGLNTFINRLQLEIEHCRKHQPFQIQVGTKEERLTIVMEQAETIHDPAAISAQQQLNQGLEEGENMEVDGESQAGGSSSSPLDETGILDAPKPGLTCLPQRAALLKSMLNFLKKAIQDPAFSDSIRHVMEGSLPNSLKHVISNAEYYGPSLFLLATDVVTAYVFQEPSLLSSLQDKGLTDVVLNALLVKEVPATREVLASLPNVFSALCLNTRGLEAFVACKPFERLFKVLLSSDYLPAMRRRRSADPLGDTASNLGNAMDELMRHQPSLKQAATSAIIKLLEQVCSLGRDPKYVCWKSPGKGDGAPPPGIEPSRAPGGGGGGEASSDEEDEEEEDAGAQAVEPAAIEQPVQEPSAEGMEKEPVPLVDYVLNVMKFVDAILSNNSTDDHCREFVSQKGLVPLMGILGLPNLPVDFPAQPACQSVASVCKSILNLAHEPQVLKQGLIHLSDVLKQLEPLHVAVPAPGSSVLLRELVSAPSLPEAINNPAATPLLHHMSAAHAYIQMFVHVCRTGQADIRTISVSHWGSELGLQVLGSLSKLYTSLVWESTVLLALCSEDTLPADSAFGKADMEKLVPQEAPSSPASGSSVDSGTGVTTAMEQLTTDSSDSNMETNAAEPAAETKEKKTSPQLQTQIKQIKPLLSGSSRLGRALAELFSLLVKLCVGSPLRQRRGQQVPPAPAMPSPPARAVATALTKLLALGLSWQPPPTSPIPKFRLTFFICSVGFTSPMLFDEKKFPYHLMLHQFVAGGGQKSFFDAFNWAITLGGSVKAEEGLENPDLPEGTGEFLDAWLMLLEKMVNPKNVLESPHLLPSKASSNFKPFDVLSYLIKTHKIAFEAVMNIWGKKPLAVYGGRMAESVLAILCHILKGENLIKERLEKEKPEEKETIAAPKETSPTTTTNATATAVDTAWSVSTPAEPDIFPDHLQTLMDMGFPRERCVEAMQTVGGSLDAATEYLLNNPAPPAAQPASLGTQDDLIRAIAMSLVDNSEGESATTTAPQVTAEEDLSTNEQEAIKEQVIDTFADTALQGCLTLLDTLPETVYRVTDLLIAIFQRNGDSFKETLLRELMGEVKSSVTELLGLQGNDLISSTAGTRAAVRIHLFTLLFEDCSRLCVELVESSDTMQEMVRLIESTQTALTGFKADSVTAADSKPLETPLATPKWVTPMLLFIDLYEKVVLSMKRRHAMRPLVLNAWKWFDISTGKWTGYGDQQNKIIDDSFWAGDASAKITSGRRKYVIQFSSMVQSNEDSGNKRPVMICLKNPDKPPAKKDQETDTKQIEAGSEEKKEDSEAKKEEGGLNEEKGNENEEEKMETEPQTEAKKPDYECRGLQREECLNLLRACVSMIAVPVEPDALNAIMRLSLRLTRDFELAAMFAELGGIKLLLGLTQMSSFTGFSSLASLLVRHVLEDGETLRHTLEKVVRASTLSNNAVTTKELNYLLRFLAPAACRNPDIFADVGRDILRVDVSLLNKRGEPEDDARLLMKSIPAKPSSTAPVLQQVSKIVISDLLDFLVVCNEEETSSDTTADDTEAPKPEGELPVSVASILTAASGGSGPTAAAAAQEAAPPFAEPTVPATATDDKGKLEKEAKTEKDKSRRPLLPKSAVCRLLAEMVKSYAGCARLITEHQYTAGMSELVKEDCSAMAFILDELLTLSTDKDCSNLVKMLVAAISSCNHAPEAQTSIVTEMKNALMRALALPECANKHNKIQALTGLISTMIESCPASAGSVQPPFKQPTVNMNNIVKCMLKKGIITDLSRVPHALDLSSPGMAASVNAAMKPLETLSKIVNQPNSLPSSKAAKPKPEVQDPVPRNGNTNTTNSEATRAQGDEVAGADNEATEHDVSTAASADPNSESGALHTVEEADTEFDEMMDQLLERDAAAEPAMLNEVAVTMQRAEHEAADELVDETVEAAREAGEDTEVISEVISDSDSSHSQDTEGSGGEEEDEMEDNEEEGEEDDEEEDEDDDGGSEVYDEDQDDFQDLEDAAFFRVPSNGAERDFDPVMMIGLNDHYPLGDDRVTFPLWGGDGSEANVSDGVGTSGNHVTPSHPLLMGRTVGETTQGTSRSQNRTLQRNRGFRYIQLNPRNGGGAGPPPGTPAILQSLLGPSTARDFLTFTGNTGTVTSNGLRDARVVVMDNAFAIFDNLDDELPGVESGLGTNSSLSTVPNALVRWTEESRVLDGDSVHDCVTAIKPRLLEVIEKQRGEEFAERREKKKKQAEEEEEARKKREEERKSKEPEAATTPAPESAGHPSGADEMDVVVSENSAVNSAVGNITEERARARITDLSISRLTEDLANAISSRVTSLPGMPGLVPTSAATPAVASADQQPTLQAGLLSQLQDYFPGVGAGAGATAVTSAAESTTSSLNSVLQSMQAAYSSAAPPNDSSTPLETSGTGGPTFEFTTPPPVFPILPARFNPLPVIFDPLPPITEGGAGAPLPDALGPLSPSPDQETQQTSENQDLTMNTETTTPQPTAQSGEESSAVGGESSEGASSVPQSSGSDAGPSGTAVAAAFSSEYAAILGDIEIPEGVDPSFLAALPEDMRQEVIEEQRRLLRARAAPPAPPAQQDQGSVAEVNPEFLAALPPNIQEEVLAQQRLEQQRQTAATTDPSAPVDPGEFLQTLPPSLRQSLLAEMEESQLQTLPADIAAEAQTLRRDFEQRNRALMHERFFNHVNHPAATLSSILRSTVNRMGGYTVHSNSSPGRAVWSRSIGRGGPSHQHSAAIIAAQTSAKFKGRQLLDHEGLSCLLILLFIDDAKLNTTRLHRILRNLCYHAPTRDWVIKCLLSILEKANCCTDSTSSTATPSLPDPMQGGSNPTPAKLRKSTSSKGGSTPGEPRSSQSSSSSSWLNISMDAALGFRANVFNVQRPATAGNGKKSSSNVISVSHINVHPQAAPVVCKNTLEVLISLAKSFSIHFLPSSSSSSKDKDSVSEEGKGKRQPEFWETLLKLDRECWTSRKGKSVVRSHSSVGIKEDEENYSSQGSVSAFGTLLSMLASPVIKRSSLLTDKLLRLLSLISLGQPEVVKRHEELESSGATSSEQVQDIDRAVKDAELQLAVEVLTSKACSEEGLEDVTALLLNLSYVGTRTRESILHLLLAGARELGNVVCQHVSVLLKELKDLKTSGNLATFIKEEDEEGKHKGVLADRFTKEAVVLTAPAKPKAGAELQLSSMSALTNKTSSQSFFLRVLKVIIQLREAALHAMKKSLKAKKDAEAFAAAKKAAANAFALPQTEAEIARDVDAFETASDTTLIGAPDTDTENSQAAAVAESNTEEAPMDVEDAATEATAAPLKSSTAAEEVVATETTTPKEEEEGSLESLSEQLALSELWETLSNCLRELANTPDHHAVLVLQPTVEAFFLVHAAVTTNTEKKKSNQKETRQEQLAHIQEEKPREESGALASNPDTISSDTQKFLAFAETHRTVLNQILRQSTTHLADGPFAVLVDHTRVLDFDIKRRYFRTELERLDEGMRREDLAVHVRREAVFEESFRELHRRSAEEWKNRFYIVFEGEEGQDAGGLLREWYVIISREIFNPNYALFKSSAGDRVTYTINDFSHINSNHLDYFKFVGRVIAKAIYDNKLLECYFTRSFYKHILAKSVKHVDMESEDYEFFKGLDFLLENKVSDLGYDLTFATEIQEFGVTEVRDLIPNGRNIVVSEDNKDEYVRLVCQMKMTGAIRKQLAAFLEGFYDIIPRRLISIFNEQELELLLSGLPDINIDDLKANTEYHKYTYTSLQIVWFWRALRSFDQTDRAKFLQFVTGSSKVPLQGFGALEGMNGAQKFQIHRDDRSTDRLPAAHTCFNQLDLPAYETYDKLRNYLLKAIQECSEGFGFA